MEKVKSSKAHFSFGLHSSVMLAWSFSLNCSEDRLGHTWGAVLLDGVVLLEETLFFSGC